MFFQGLCCLEHFLTYVTAIQGCTVSLTAHLHMLGQLPIVPLTDWALLLLLVNIRHVTQKMLFQHKSTAADWADKFALFCVMGSLFVDVEPGALLVCLATFMANITLLVAMGTFVLLQIPLGHEPGSARQAGVWFHGLVTLMVTSKRTSVSEYLETYFTAIHRTNCWNSRLKIEDRKQIWALTTIKCSVVIVSVVLWAVPYLFQTSAPFPGYRISFKCMV